ncbi:UDP-glucose 6-dehydrogenase [Enterococcus pernyi]
MNITVIGLGYVGLSQALLFSRKNRVFAYDSDHFKIVQLKSGKSPIDEPLVIDELKKENCNLIFTDELEKAITLSDYAFICVPTNFSEEKMAFDTMILETVLHQVFRLKKSIKAVIKSTVPVGFTTRLKQTILCFLLNFYEKVIV